MSSISIFAADEVQSSSYESDLDEVKENNVLRHQTDKKTTVPIRKGAKPNDVKDKLLQREERIRNLRGLLHNSAGTIVPLLPIDAIAHTIAAFDMEVIGNRKKSKSLETTLDVQQPETFEQEDSKQSIPVNEPIGGRQRSKSMGAKTFSELATPRVSEEAGERSLWRSLKKITEPKLKKPRKISNIYDQYRKTFLIMAILLKL